MFEKFKKYLFLNTSKKEKVVDEKELFFFERDLIFEFFKSLQILKIKLNFYLKNKIFFYFFIFLFFIIYFLLFIFVFYYLYLRVNYIIFWISDSFLLNLFLFTFLIF